MEDHINKYKKAYAALFTQIFSFAALLGYNHELATTENIALLSGIASLVTFAVYQFRNKE